MIILIFNLFMEFKTRFDVNLIAGEIIDRLIIDNDNNWNDNKTRANERHELAKLHFRDFDERSENVNIQMKYDISIYKIKKIKSEEIFKRNENFFI
jgi:hypothetical protein